VVVWDENRSLPLRGGELFCRRGFFFFSLRGRTPSPPGTFLLGFFFFFPRDGNPPRKKSEIKPSFCFHHERSLPRNIPTRPRNLASVDLFPSFPRWSCFFRYSSRRPRSRTSFSPAPPSQRPPPRRSSLCETLMNLDWEEIFLFSGERAFCSQPLP